VRKAKIDYITVSEFEVTITDAMSDNDDCDSESSGAELVPQQLDDDVRTTEETTIDLSRENAGLNGEGVKALVASSTSRAYQLEMLEESLRRNIIVAVCCPSRGGYSCCLESDL